MGLAPIIEWVRGGFDKPFRDLQEDIYRRVEDFGIYYWEMGDVTAGRISFERLVRSRSVLDVGMGRGALAILLRSSGMQGRIVGIDETQYEGVTGYEFYDRLVFESVVAKGWLVGEEFEYVVCFAPAPEVLDWVKTSSRAISLIPGGQIIIATEQDVSGFNGFEVFHGSGGYKNYLLRDF